VIERSRSLSNSGMQGPPKWCRWHGRGRAAAPGLPLPVLVHKLLKIAAPRPESLRFAEPRADNYGDHEWRDRPVQASDLISKTRDRLADQVSAQHLRLIDDIAALIRESEARGTLKSNETLMQSTLLCCETVQNRLDIFLETLKGVLKGSDIIKAEIGATEIKELVAEFFRPNDPFIREQLSSVVVTIGAPDVVEKLQNKVERTRAHTLTRLGVEIDILCRRLTTRKAMFWQSQSFAKGVLAVEITCSLLTIWFAYVWIHNPTTTVSVQMVTTGSLVYLLGRLRRYIQATY
jgi:hypothetical protein